jgi:Putative prokaryotic signal transducing protein
MDPVRLTVVRTEPEAEIICSLLRANGIECASSAADLSSQVFGGSVEVLVHSRDLDAARQLLDAPAEEPGPPPPGD